MHARGIEHSSHGVQNCLGAINIVLASGRIGREGCGYATITGQGNGQGGREHGQKCDQLPGARDLANPDHRAYVAGVWGVPADELPAARRRRLRDLPQDRPRRNPRVALDLLQSARVAAGQRLRPPGCWRSSTSTSPSTSFSTRRARYADVVLPGSLQEEDEGIVTTTEGRVIKINKAIACPGEAREDWRIIQDIAAGPRPSPRIHVRLAARDPGRAAGGVEGRHRGLRRDHLREDSRPSTGSSGRAPPRTIRARRGSSRRAPGIRSPRATDPSTSPTGERTSSSPRTRLRPRCPTKSIR